MDESCVSDIQYNPQRTWLFLPRMRQARGLLPCILGRRRSPCRACGHAVAAQPGRGHLLLAPTRLALWGLPLPCLLLPLLLLPLPHPRGPRRALSGGCGPLRMATANRCCNTPSPIPSTRPPVSSSDCCS